MRRDRVHAGDGDTDGDKGNVVKIHDVVQGTEKWLAVRAGIPTASELGSLITDGGELRKWDTEMPNTYLARKLAERWTGYPLQSFGGGVMEQGAILEEEAIPWYCAEYRVDLQRVGFLTTDDGSFGSSPDAIDDERGYEIKCPQPTNHVKWLLAGGCPAEHVLQCQGGMYVMECDEWRFVSYCRGVPLPLVVTVEQDAKIQDVIDDAMDHFRNHMEEAWAVLLDKNGGPPIKRNAPRVVERPSDPFAVGPEFFTPNFRSKP